MDLRTVEAVSVLNAMVEFLIDAGADPCERVLEDAPLRTADPDLPDARGMTPFEVAKAIQNDRAIPVLLEATKSC